jgi:hypothetical protein
MEAQQAAPETLPNLDFMDVDAVDALRAQQAAAINHAQNEVLKDYDVFAYMQNREAIDDELAAGATAANESVYTDYLNSHVDRDSDPDLYDRLLDLLDQSSVEKMDSEEWHLGERDADGKHTQPETSGKSILASELSDIRGDYDEPDDLEDDHEEDDEEDEDDEFDPAISDEERVRRHDDLNAARANLAKLSYQCRQLNREGGKKNAKLLDEFKAAQLEYDNAVYEVGLIQTSDMRHNGVAPAAMLATVTSETILEFKMLAQEERAVMEADDSRRGKFAKWLAKGHRLQIVSGVFGFSLGVGSKLIGGAAGVAAAASAPVAAAAAASVVAARTSGAVLAATVGNRAHNIKHFDVRKQQDEKSLRDRLAGLTLAADPDTFHETMVDHANNHLQNVVTERGQQDRRSNRKRVITAAAISGGAAILGAGVTALVEHTDVVGHIADKFHDHPNGSGTHGAQGGPTQGSGTGNTPPSGSGTDGTTPGSGTPSSPEGAKDLVDGYHADVNVEAGTGYQHALHELAAQKHLNLTDDQSWKLYQHLNHEFHGDFFTNNDSYAMGQGNYGISHAGASHWNPQVIHAMNEWMQQHADEISTASSN